MILQILNNGNIGIFSLHKKNVFFCANPYFYTEKTSLNKKETGFIWTGFIWIFLDLLRHPFWLLVLQDPPNRTY